MKDTTKTFVIKITIAQFGTLAKFYKTYAKKNREIIVEQVDDKDTDEQHVSGIMIDEIICKRSELKDKVMAFIDKNSLYQECFDVNEEGKKKSILSETDL